MVAAYISHANIGLGIESRLGHLFGLSPDSYLISYGIGFIVAILFMITIPKISDERKTTILNYDRNLEMI